MGEDMEAPAAGEQTLAAKIMAIQRDPNLTDQEKAKKRQELMCGNWRAQAGGDELDEGVLVHCCTCTVVLGCLPGWEAPCMSANAEQVLLRQQCCSSTAMAPLRCESCRRNLLYGQGSHSISICFPYWATALSVTCNMKCFVCTGGEAVRVSQLFEVPDPRSSGN